MLRTSPSKKVTPINVFNFQQMTYIKYLDVYRDQKLNWKDQKTHVKTKAWVAKNIGVLYKF